MVEGLPLAGIRVADFTQVIIGPYCTMMMGEMGAEIIKVETSARAGVNRTRAGFNTLNASKKSITLDLKHPKGVELAKRLVAVSDIAMENFGTGVMERFGLGYEELRQVRPDLIMMSTTALGRSGPYRHAIGYYAEVNSFAGYSYLTGHRDHGPGQVGGIWTDHFTGMLALFTILSALRYRRETGKGQYIELTMAENILSSIPEAILDYAVNGRDRGPQENEDPTMAPHNVYRCRGFDKWVAIAVTNAAEWEALCRVLGDPPWTQEDRFADPIQRLQHKEALDALITEWTSQREDLEVMRMLQAAGVPASAVLDAAGLAEDPHLNERGFLVPLGEVEGKMLHIPSLPWRLSDSPPPFYRLAPKLGEHTQHVLCDILGLSVGEAQELQAEGVLS